MEVNTGTKIKQNIFLEQNKNQVRWMLMSITIKHLSVLDCDLYHKNHSGSKWCMKIGGKKEQKKVILKM